MLIQGNGSKLLHYIEEYENCFIETIEARKDTSLYNKNIHEKMLLALKSRNWGLVDEIVTSEDYAKPLEGVIFTLQRYTGMSFKDFNIIIEAYEERRLTQ